MGLLDGDIANAIYGGFKGRLLKGTLKRDALPDTPTLNDRGFPVATEPVSWACQGFVDRYSAMYRRNAGIPETDSKVCIFGKSLPDGVTPRKDDKVVFVTAGLPETWQLRTTDIDPAGALWECQAYRVPNE